MKLFYANSGNRPDAPSSSPVEASLERALVLFRDLDTDSGFMGIILDPPFTLQFKPEKQGEFRVELLDSSRPEFDACVADAVFVESLIRAAAEGQDVFQIARAGNHEWEHTDL